jgi:hypothetical protein
MAAIDFPNPSDLNPDTGDQYANGWYNAANGVTYVYANNTWSAATVNNANFDDLYVNEEGGDHMEGPLTIGPDSDVNNAVVKIGSTALGDGDIQVGGDALAQAGVNIYDNGQIISTASSNTEIFRIHYPSRPEPDTVEIRSTGDATFAGDVQMASQNGGPLAGFRNLIINGNFTVQQRGTSFSAPADVYTADRWWMGNAAGRNVGFTSDGPYQNAMLITNNTSDNVFLRQGIEIQQGKCGPFTLGSVWTLSLWSDSNAWVGRHLGARAFRNAGNMGNSVGEAGVTATAFAATGETASGMSRYALQITIDASPAATHGMFVIGLSLPSGGHRISAVQLEPGPVATPFEHRPVGIELALCQRYYQNIKVRGTVFNRNANSFATLPLAVRIEMRTNPTSLTPQIAINQRSNSTTNTNVTITEITNGSYARLASPTNEGTTQSDIWQVQSEGVALDAEL